MVRSPIWTAFLVTVILVAFFIGLALLTLSWLRQGKSWTGGEKVGVVEVKGLIADSRTVIKQLDRYKDDRGIKAVVLQVNSPGGAVGPSQEIMREVSKLRQKKKVVASLGTLATSGGYYIACAADLIMANPGTTTGSIGVIMQFANVEQLTKKLGVDMFAMKAGRYKDVGSPFRPMTPEDKVYVQHLLDNVYQQFVRDVAKNRRIPLEKMKELAEGQIYTGEEAKQIGLVDELGDLPDAIEKAGWMSGIKGKVEAVYPEKEGFSLLRFLLGQNTEDTLANWFSLAYPEPAFLPAWFK